MARSTFSQHWFRVSELKLRLRSHATIHRQSFRGETWYMLQDNQNGRYHRLSPSANHMLCLMDGRRTIAEIWTMTNEWAGSERVPPTQDDVIRLLSQLHGADLLAGDRLPDVSELVHRADTKAWQTLMNKLKSPFAFRIPLWDPDRFLTATMGVFRPVFTIWGLVVWFSVVMVGGTIAILNWDPLTKDFVDQIFLTQNLFLLALLYPFIKIVHEFAHGYAVKNWGGEVHETGFMLLVLYPIPYVDASASTAFHRKWERALVGSAGILAELFIAGLAMIVWANVESGFIRAMAYNVALIGGVSSLLFNGNPLLRFDGYYVLADLIEIPNLGTRADKHFFYLVKRYLFGMTTETSPATARGERSWFVFYSVTSFCYRLFVMLGIALFVAEQFSFIGIGLAIWTIAIFLLWPIAKGGRWLASSSELHGRRYRAMAVSGLLSLVIILVLFAAPVPFSTIVEGVVQVPEESILRSQASGTIVMMTDAPDVKTNDVVMRLEDPELLAQRDLLRAEYRERRLKLERELLANQAGRNALVEQLRYAKESLRFVEEDVAGLVLMAPRAGSLLVPQYKYLPGEFVARGELIGFVVKPEDLMIRVAVPQDRVEFVRHQLQGVEVMMAHAIGKPFRAEIIRAAPKARKALPSRVLGTEGGGQIVMNPSAQDSAEALESHFYFDLTIPDEDVMPIVGQRAYVRFDHGSEPVIYRIAYEIRQLFLRKFSV